MARTFYLGLMYAEQLPRAVRQELEQLVAAIQQQAGNEIPAELIPMDEIEIDASQITSGILRPERGGTGVDGSEADDGELLIGNGTGFTLATLTAGAGLSITNGSGSITLAVTGGGGGAGTAAWGHLTQDGSSAPPVDLYTEDGTDWLYADGE